MGTTPRRLPTWALVGIGVCAVGILGVALVPPYELLDGSFIPIGAERRFLLADTPTGRGFWRLNLTRLAAEEGILISCAAFFTLIGRLRSDSSAQQAE